MSHLSVNYPPVVVSTGTTADLGVDTDLLLVTTNGLVRLPLISAARRKFYTIKNRAAGTVDITPAAGNTIDTASIIYLTRQFASVTLYPDGGTTWLIVSGYNFP